MATHLMLHIKQLLAGHVRCIFGAIGHSKILALSMREIFANYRWIEIYTYIYYIC